MKRRGHRPLLWSSLLSGGLIAYGCATTTPDAGTGDRPFAADNRVESMTKDAEISMDLMEVAALNDPDAPASAGAEATTTLSDPTPLTGEVVHYRTKKGDTLMKLAFQFTGSVYRWREILKQNQSKIADFNHLVPGTELEISTHGAVKVSHKGRPYAIRLGDSLTKISRWLYGSIAKWRVLWHNNPQLIKNPNRIYAGFRLYYPGPSVHDPKMAPVAPASVKDPEPLPLDLPQAKKK
ncbi:MAG: LysM peptidoglycan-binding domain-containing protein [Bdellovibrionota bacterium]